jgi:PAS domain S-box-containing protein
MYNPTGWKPAILFRLFMSPRAATSAAKPFASLRLMSLLLASIALLLAMSGVATWNLRMQRVEGDWVAHSNQIRYQLLKILQLMVDAQTGASGFVLGSVRALQTYRDASPLIEPAIERLKQLTSDDPKQRQLTAQLDGMARDLAVSVDTLLAQARNGDAPVRALIDQGHIDDVMADVRSLLAQMQAEEDQIVIERRITRDRARRDAALALWATGGLGAMLLVLIVYFTRRDEASLRRAERELATTLRSIGDAVIATDVTGTIRFMNPIAETLTGWDEGSARGQPLAQVLKVMGEKSRAPVESPAALVLQEGKAMRLAHHTVLIARDGTERAIADSGAPIVDETGKVQGMVLVFRDVSEDRRAQRLLQQRDAELQVINEYARFPVARCDPQHRYLFVNKAYAERFGLCPEECVGKHIREVTGELAYQSIRSYVEDALAGNLVEFEIELHYAHMQGARWMRCIYAPVRDEAGDVTSIVAALTDITERKEAELKLQRSEAALKETDRRKDEFIATLSHELRNPLAPIRTAAKLLASPDLKRDQLQRAQMIIERQVTHMAFLLNDLLDIARITQRKFRLKKKFIALLEVVDVAIEATRPLVESKKQRLTVSLPAEQITLEADPVRLSQILTNLLTNAAKYSDAGGHITVAAIIQDQTLRLSVKDEGIGIATENIGGIFDMFSQIEGAFGRSDGGLGIGLALVKGLTDLHGGTVEVQSEGMGRGSEFIVRLPLPVAATTAVLSPQLQKPMVRPPPRRRILVADDNQDAAESLATLLELSGHELRIAHLGRTALALAQTFRPEVALLDIGMPDLSGYEVAQKLRQAAWADGMQLIALTGWGQEDDRRRALEAGFDHHLIKPVDPDQLDAIIAAQPAKLS